MHAGAANFELRLATKVHEIWRQTQPLLPDGTRRPRLKSLPKHEQLNGSAVADIANLPFEKLPQKWKQSNLTAARTVVGEILRHIKASNLYPVGSKKLDLDFVERAAHFTHQQWIIERQHSSDTSALVPYYLLPPKNKNLLRKLVRQGIDLYDPELDRMNNALFPPRGMVVVALPPLVEVVDTEKKPWEEAVEDLDEEERRVCFDFDCCCCVCASVYTAKALFHRS